MDPEQLATRVAALESVSQNVAGLFAWNVVLNARLDLLGSRLNPKPTSDETSAAIEAAIMRIGDRLPIPAELIRAELVKLGYLPPNEGT